MHEYLRETLSWKYDVCRSCDYRTPFTCIWCKYCWSCHRKKEHLEKNKLTKKRIEQYRKWQVEKDSGISNTLAINMSRLQKERMETVQSIQSPPQKVMINVFGEEEPDPICNYLNCSHTFSMHENSNVRCKGTCGCRHPQNSVTGLK